MKSIDSAIQRLEGLRKLRDAEWAIQLAIDALREKQERDLGAQSAAAVVTDTSADTPREV